MKALKTGLKALALVMILSVLAHAGVDDGYVPAAQGDLDKENISAPLFMAIAYAVMWSGFVVFLLMLYKRVRVLSDRLRAAEQRVRELESSPAQRNL